MSFSLNSFFFADVFSFHVVCLQAFFFRAIVCHTRKLHCFMTIHEQGWGLKATPLPPKIFLKGSCGEFWEKVARFWRCLKVILKLIFQQKKMRFPLHFLAMLKYDITILQKKISISMFNSFVTSSLIASDRGQREGGGSTTRT